MKKLVLIALMFTLAGFASAQTRVPTKVGYVDFALLRDTLPQTDTAEQEIQMATLQYQQQILELEKRLQQLKGDLDTTTNKSFISYLQKDMANTQQQINTKYQEAEYVIGQLQQEAIARLNYVISLAVNEVAKAQKYTLVLDSSTGSIVYGLPQDDLTKAVAKALKVKI